MKSAAGTCVRTRKTGDPHVTLQFFFTSVFKFFQLFSCRIKCNKRVVFPDITVCFFFYLKDLLITYTGAVIDRYDILTHMKANIITVKSAADHSAYDMLAGMLLHVIKPALPVDLSMHLHAFGNLRRQAFNIL